MRSRYQSAYQREVLLTRLGEPVMGHPRQVARVIADAMSTRFVRSRYLVGYDARAFAVVQQVVPTAIKDRVTRVIMGL